MNLNSTEDATSSERKRALVLSGGGGRGAFECGVIEKLAELGWQPDVLVGTSIGAMNAAVLAIGGDKAVRAMWDEIPRRGMHRLFRRPPWPSILDRAQWERALEDFAPQEKLNQVARQLYIVTTNIKTGHPLQGEALPASRSHQPHAYPGQFRDPLGLPQGHYQTSR
jgi:predicted acylesterase/phospholipase RssA